MSTNLFKRLKRLLPDPVTQVGTVTAVGNGVVTVQESGRAPIVIRGSASVGERVYFVNGAVQGPAPSLPLEVVEE